MAKMKDSGIEWIGEIPEDWEVKKLKYVSNENEKTLSENTDPNFEFDYVDIGSVKYGKGITDFQRMCFSKSPSRARRIVRKGDVIVSTVRTYLKSVANILDFDIPIIVSTGFSVLSAKNKIINQEFLKFSVLCESFTSMVEAYSVGITYPAINSSSLINLKIPLPPPETQKRIADFLDAKCSKIDTLKTDIQKQIETLEQYKKSVITEAVTGKLKFAGINPNAKMKESGIDDVEQIPESWEEKKIKFLFDLVNDQNHLPMDKVQLLSLYTELGVFPHGEQEERGNKAVTVEGYKKVKKNDLVVNIILAWMGAMGISNYDGVTSPAYDIYRPKSENANPKYYHYLFRTPWFAGECDKYGRGIMRMRWRTYSQEFMNIKIPYPSPEEQKQIADYLDKKCSSIDSIISTKKQQLEKLEEYKKSLIFEYVTGKREVSCEFPSETSGKKEVV